MKKVLLVATVQSHIAQFHKPLMKLLKDYGYEVHVAARNNLYEKCGLVIENEDVIFDIAFDRSPFSLKNIKAYQHLKQVIVDNDYDVVHCNTPVGGVLTRLICKNMRKKGLKVFYTSHGFHFYKGCNKSAWLIYYTIEKILARFTDKLIVISNEDYQTAKEKKFVCQVHRIHGVGANTDKFFEVDQKTKNTLRKQENIEQDDFVCVCAGELLPNKNQSTLIKATAYIINKVPNFRLLLAGNGYMDGKLQCLIDDLGLNNHVKLIGYRMDLERFMQLSDVVASASIREGLGLNLVEAMLCKKPVVCSTNRGHNELVTDGMNGYKFSPLDEKTFADIIIKIWSDPELYHFLCEKTLQVAQPYTKTAVAQQLKEIYEL